MSEEKKEPEFDLVPILEFKWTDDFSFMRDMTCKNHPTALYSTKNPWQRSIHILKYPEGDIPRSPSGECTCPFSDLVVKVYRTKEESTDNG